MLLTKLKIVSAVFLGIAIVGVSTGRWLYSVKGEEPVIVRQEGKKESVPTTPAKKATSDKDKMQGTWQVLVDKAEKQKQLFRVEEYKSSTFSVRGDKFEWQLKSKKVKGTLRLNEQAKTFLLAYEEDGIEGKYRIEGDEIELVGTVGYVRNKVLPGLSPNPIVLKRKTSEDVAKKELIGVWEVVSVVSKGKQVEQIFYDGSVWVFDGNKIRGIGGSTTYVLNPSQTPKTIDVTHKPRISNTEYGPVVTDPGIYELRGDELRIALRKSEHGRPKDFESTAENHTNLTVLKRVRLER